MTARTNYRLTKILVGLAVGAWLAVASLVLALDHGPDLEAHLAPIRVDQRVEDVVRTRDRLCWAWSSRKVRPAASDDLDVYLSAEGIEGRMVVAVTGEEDGLPWRGIRATPLGWSRKRWCVDVPARVSADAPVWLEMTVWYPSLTRLWRVPLRMPVVGATRATPELPPERPPPG